jgi:hypothetical protein
MCVAIGTTLLASRACDRKFGPEPLGSGRSRISACSRAPARVCWGTATAPLYALHPGWGGVYHSVNALRLLRRSRWLFAATCHICCPSRPITHCPGARSPMFPYDIYALWGRGAPKKKINAHVHVQRPSKSTHPPRFFCFFFTAFFGVSHQGQLAAVHRQCAAVRR